MATKIKLYKHINKGDGCGSLTSYAIRKPDGTWMIVAADIYPGEDVFIEENPGTTEVWERVGKFVCDLEPKQILTHEQFVARFARGE